MAIHRNLHRPYFQYVGSVSFAPNKTLENLISLEQFDSLALLQLKSDALSLPCNQENSIFGNCVCLYVILWILPYTTNMGVNRNFEKESPKSTMILNRYRKNSRFEPSEAELPKRYQRSN